MNHLPPAIAQALAPFAPPQSEARRIAADLAYNADKRTFHERNDRAALALQIQQQDKVVSA